MNIGFYLLDVTPDDPLQNQILSSINNFCLSNPYYNVVVFNNQFNKVDVNHKYYMLHIQQAKYFDGILFIFDIKSAMLTQSFPSPKKQIFYVSESDWSKNTTIPYGFWYNIYMKENIEIITDNPTTYDLFEICWKKPLKLISEINAEEFKNVISEL